MPKKAESKRDEDVVKFTTYITRGQRKRLKVLAAMTERDAAELLREILEEGLAKRER